MKIELKDYPNNPRTICDDALSKLGKSMQEFGDLSGIVLNKRDGYLISGHQRVKSLLERYGKYDIDIVEMLPDGEQRGYVEPEHISFRLVDWDEGKAGAARLAANKHGGEWEQDKLEKELKKLIDLDIDMDLSGFDDDEINIDTNFDNKEIAHKTLQERFLIPPFSVLDARQGYWQERKRAWIALGIKGEEGRKGDILINAEQLTTENLNYYRNKKNRHNRR